MKGSESYGSNASDDNHDDAEAQEDTNPQFLTSPDSHTPKDTHGDTNDCQQLA